MLRDMLDLSLILRNRRKQRGGIDFEIPESKITVDENGNVLVVRPYERNESHKLIEDLMLAANETGMFPSLAEGVERSIKVDEIIQPDPEWVKVYDSLYPHFIQMYQSLDKDLKRIDDTLTELRKG